MDCPVCSSKGMKKFDFNSYTIFKCLKCNAEYLSDLEESRDHLYSNDYWMDFSDKRIKKIAEYNLFMVLKNILAYNHSGSLLDVGGGNLIFASLASKYFDVSVVDLNPASSKKVKTIKSDFLSFKTEEKYDVITAFSFIEHVPFPDKLFSKFSKILKKGGMLFLITPDVGSFASKILGKKWYQYKHEHVLLYSKKSLSMVSLQHKLKMLSFKPHFPFLTPYYLLKYSEKYRMISPFFDNILRKFFSIFSYYDFKLINPFAGEAFVVFKKQY